MTPEQQRICIAEACGWKWVTTGPLYSPWVCPNTKEQFPKPPDYLNDLNAMHEAENGLGDVQRLQYTVKLREIVGGFTFDMINATAAQKAEAFLNATGKWAGVRKETGEK